MSCRDYLLAIYDMVDQGGFYFGVKEKTLSIMARLIGHNLGCILEKAMNSPDGCYSDLETLWTDKLFVKSLRPYLAPFDSRSTKSLNKRSTGTNYG